MSRHVTLAVATLLALTASSGPARGAAPPYLDMWGSAGTGPGHFELAHGIAVGPTGTVYVADTENARVQTFSASGGYLGQWPTPATCGGIAVSGAGDVYVACDHTIVRYTAGGAFVGSWGGAGTGPGQFDYVGGLAVDATGFVYADDWLNGRIEKFTAAGVFVAAFGSPGSGPGQLGGFADLAVSGAVLYAADAANDRIERFTTDGTYVDAWGAQGAGPGQFDFPAGIAVDAAGFVDVVDAGNSRVQAFHAGGAFVTQWGGAGSGPGQFTNPAGIAVGDSGRIYVDDKDNARIEVFGNLATPVTRLTWGTVKRLYRQPTSAGRSTCGRAPAP